MNCPRCRTPLVIVEYHDIELDWCPACEGLWFNRGEMELLALKLGRPAHTPSTGRETQVSEKRLKCPECNRNMMKRLLGDSCSVLADVCGECGGLWLDHGELEQLLGAPRDGSHSDLIMGHLRDTFADG